MIAGLKLKLSLKGFSEGFGAVGGLYFRIYLIHGLFYS